MYGARPLKRAIQRQVESPLSKRLLAGEFTEGSTILIDLGENELTFLSKGEVESKKAKPTSSEKA